MLPVPLWVQAALDRDLADEPPHDEDDPGGRYLLGAAEDFQYAPAAEGEVVVQPDFDHPAAPGRHRKGPRRPPQEAP
jgi:hypothetical protein